MGSSVVGPRYYDPIIYPSYNYYNPYPARRIIVVNRPMALPPQFVPIPNQRIIIGPNNMIMVPHGPPVHMVKQKQTIDNLGEIIGEQTLTKEMLEKGEQKNCSICLEDFSEGDKIIYLPCFHYYHSVCIEKWTKSSNKCPLCNIEIKV